MGRFISADAFTSTGQGLLGNNMFAYCNNNPVCYDDPTGYLSAARGIGNPNAMMRGGGCYRGGIIPDIDRADTVQPHDPGFAFMEETTATRKGTKTARILGGEWDLFSIGLKDFMIISLEVSVISLDLELEQYALSLFNLGNASFALGISGGKPVVDLLASVWSPAVSFDVFGVTVTTAAHFGAYGGKFIVTSKRAEFGFANVIGLSVAIDF